MFLQDWQTWAVTHVWVVKDLVEFQYKQYLHRSNHMESMLVMEWGQTEHELMRERGLWGPPVGSSLDKWMLDMTEGWFACLSFVRSILKIGQILLRLYVQHACHGWAGWGVNSRELK